MLVAFPDFAPPKVRNSYSCWSHVIAGQVRTNVGCVWAIIAKLVNRDFSLLLKLWQKQAKSVRETSLGKLNLQQNKTWPLSRMTIVKAAIWNAPNIISENDPLFHQAQSWKTYSWCCEIDGRLTTAWLQQERLASSEIISSSACEDCVRHRSDFKCQSLPQQQVA